MLRFGDLVDSPSVHEVGAEEVYKGEQTLDAFLGGPRHLEQQECDEGDSGLSSDGIFAGAEEVAVLQGLLDPSEKRLDSPTAFVEVGNVLSRRIEVVARSAKGLVDLGHDADLTNWIAEAGLAAATLSARQHSDVAGEHIGAFGRLELSGDRQRRMAR